MAAKKLKVQGHPALSAFYSAKGDTPANAIRLAIEDHKSFNARTPSNISWQYVTALQEAAKICDVIAAYERRKA